MSLNLDPKVVRAAVVSIIVLVVALFAGDLAGPGELLQDAAATLQVTPPATFVPTESPFPTPTIERVTPAPSATPLPAVCQIMNTSTYELNLRSAGSLSGSITGSMQPGDKAEVLSYTSAGREGWLHILVITGEYKGTRAYMAGWLNALTYGAECRDIP